MGICTDHWDMKKLYGERRSVREKGYMIDMIVLLFVDGRFV